jgi:hypothetical protein
VPESANTRGGSANIESLLASLATFSRETNETLRRLGEVPGPLLDSLMSSERASDEKRELAGISPLTLSKLSVGRPDVSLSDCSLPAAKSVHHRAAGPVLYPRCEPPEH